MNHGILHWWSSCSLSTCINCSPKTEKHLVWTCLSLEMNGNDVFINSSAHNSSLWASLICVVVMLFTVSWSLAEALSHKKKLGHHVTSSRPQFLFPPCTTKLWLSSSTYPAEECPCSLLSSLAYLSIVLLHYNLLTAMAGTHFRGARN